MCDALLLENIWLTDYSKMNIQLYSGKLLEESPEGKEVVLLFLIPFIITKVKDGGLRNGSEVQSEYCSCRRPKKSSQHPCQAADITSI